MKQLENEIKRLCPEICELKFGCKLQNRFSKKHKPYIFLRKKNKNQWMVWMEQFNEEGLFDIKNHFIEDNNDTFEILGRNINLDDVLKSFPALSIQRGQEFEEEERWLKCEGKPSGVKWELGKGLKEQKPEVVEFLSKLILNK